MLEHPCLPKGSNSTELLIGDEAAQADAVAAGANALPPLSATWHGKGHYDDCVEKLAELFDKTAPCYLPACDLELYNYKLYLFNTCLHDMAWNEGKDMP